MSTESPLVSGRYRVRRSVGRGGMAEVFLAHDELLDRQVVLKVLFPEFATDPAFVERFRREAQSAAGLAHPNVVAVYDWGTLNNTYFIAMEYVQGKSLAELVRSSGPLSVGRACDIGIEIAAALGFAHDSGVVHRDVKPANVLISATGQVKVADFGIARALGAAVEDGLTQTGEVMGTATYLSPEQAQGAQPDPRSDVYSLGVLLYEVVAGRAPFVGDNAVAITYQHVHTPPTPLRRLRPDVPREFEAVVAKCMAKSPSRRYESAHAVRDDLRRVLGGDVPLALRELRSTESSEQQTVAIPVTPAGVEDLSLPPYEDDPSGLAPGRTAGLVFGAVFVAILLLGAGLFLVRTLGGGSASPAVLPDVTNIALPNATRILLDLGLTPVPNAIPREGVGDDVVYQQDPPPGVTVRPGDVVTITYNPAAAKITVPPLQGLLLGDANAILAPIGLQFAVIERRVDPTVPNDQIISQDPPAGTDVAPGTTISLVVSAGPGDQVVPNVEGQSADAARALLSGSPYGFVVSLLEEESDIVPAGRVVRTDPPIGTTVLGGASITIVVSRGAVTVEVPALETLLESEAISSLSIAGLRADVRYQNVPAADPNVGRVISQGVPAGSRVKPGSTVVITVGRAAPEG